MMIRRFGFFFAAQMTRPAWVILHFAFLARTLGSENFATFVPLYVLGNTLAVFSDVGQHQIALGAMRDSTDDEARAVVSWTARRVKRVGSATLLLAGLLVAAGGLAPASVVIALSMLAVTSPQGDVGVALLRGANKPQYEVAAVNAEQAAVLSLLWAGSQAGLLTPVNALWAYVLPGLIRMTATDRLCRQVIPADIPGDGRGVMRSAARSVPAALSVLAASGYSRFPLFIFPELLDPTFFAVFAGFWTLFQRGQIVPNALLQTAFKSGAGLWDHLFSSLGWLALIGLGYGAVVGAFVIPLAPLLTQLYLGEPYMDQARAVTVAMLLALPSYAIFLLRSALQYAGRGWHVTLAFATALTVAGLPRLLMDLDDGWIFLPYALSSLFCLVFLVSARKL